MIELTIKLEYEDLTFIEKHVVHEEGLCLSHDDPVLGAFVNAAINAFKCGGQPDVLVKIKYTW